MSRPIRILLIAITAVILTATVWAMFGPLTLWLAGPDLEQLDAKDRIAAFGTIRGQVATVLSAVDHLGSTDVTVRAGGIRALERILHDSPRDRDRVLKTITGYLRTHTTITTDNQIALRDADLTGADLSSADLRHADLRGARLDRDAAVMSGQLQHLLLTAALSNVDIHVIPSAAGVHAGHTGAFTLLESDAHTPVVHIEGRGPARPRLVGQRADACRGLQPG